MAKIPDTRYAKNGDRRIAYQVMGSGPFDLVLVMGSISHLDLGHENPWIVRFLERLSSFCRLILFDKRGTRLSDRVSAMPTLEERMSDVRAVMDAVGSERAVEFAPLTETIGRLPCRGSVLSGKDKNWPRLMDAPELFL